MLERVVALAVVATAGVYLTQALALPYGTTARPGAGFFPTMVALFACAVGLVMTAQAFLADPAGGTPRETEPARAPHGGHVCTTVVLLVAFCLLLPWVGYPVVAFALVAVLLHRLGSGWRSALAIGGLTALASHYLFAVLLDVPLPRGPW